MEDCVRVVKLHRSDSVGYGFSVFGGQKSGFPPVIYEVLKNSPADNTGILETGDVIISVNGKEVLSLTTKEVLKCLRLSNDVVTLKVKKDHKIKTRIYAHMAHSSELSTSKEPPLPQQSTDAGNVFNNDNQNLLTDRTSDEKSISAQNKQNIECHQPHEKCKHPQPKFETFMMTGDMIINLNTESTNPTVILPQKKNLDSVPISDDRKVNCDIELQTEIIKEETNEYQPVPVKNWYNSGGCVRTSKSDDCLQQVPISAANTDNETNCANSFCNLLDTSKDSAKTDRIVWTYNAPISALKSKSDFSDEHNGNCSVENMSKILNVDEGASNQHSDNKSSVNYSENLQSSYNENNSLNPNFLNNIGSSLSNNVNLQQQQLITNILVDENKIYVKILPEQESISKSDIKNCSQSSQKFKQNNHKNGKHDEERVYSSVSGDEDLDIESLHSFHYSPKAIDMPSALRLAKRLYNLEGFKKSDVARHLCKNNDFSRVVAEEYLRFFDFTEDTLDIALRKFLRQFCLIGETQERERVLLHFSRRYLECNVGTFESHDSVHTLTCALMLLNTDLHGGNVGRRMTCGDFIENLSQLNEGENFPRDLLKTLYHSIKLSPLEWAMRDADDGSGPPDQIPEQKLRIGRNPFLEVPNPNSAIEYKKGYVMRKCCIDANGKKTPLGKRSWKMFYATLRDLVLYLHKDEDGFKRNQLYENLHNSIRIHHALATKATDYTKKHNVFRLQAADQAEYLFQTRYLGDSSKDDSKELQSWIEAINYAAASLSAPPLAAAIGSSQKKFHRPLLPVSHTKLNLKEQLLEIETCVLKFEKELEEHLICKPLRTHKSRHINDFIQKEAYLQSEVQRYRTYEFLLRSKTAQFPDIESSHMVASIGEDDESIEKTDIVDLVSSTSDNKYSCAKSSLSDRYSYRAAIYKNE